jgi:hypothetical protein
VLLNYHIGRLILSSLCVGALVRLVLGGVRFTGFSLQHEHYIYVYLFIYGPFNTFKEIMNRCCNLFFFSESI